MTRFAEPFAQSGEKHSGGRPFSRGSAMQVDQQQIVPHIIVSRYAGPGTGRAADAVIDPRARHQGQRAARPGDPQGKIDVFPI